MSHFYLNFLSSFGKECDGISRRQAPTHCHRSPRQIRAFSIAFDVSRPKSDPLSNSVRTRVTCFMCAKECSRKRHCLSIHENFWDIQIRTGGAGNSDFPSLNMSPARHIKLATTLGFTPLNASSSLIKTSYVAAS